MATKDLRESSQPVKVILDGTNYLFWSQQMISFLKERKLWRYVTGDIPQPTRKADETDEAFAARLDDWDSNNHKIITWILNMSSINIAIEFGKYETVKKV